MMPWVTLYLDIGQLFKELVLLQFFPSSSEQVRFEEGRGVTIFHPPKALSLALQKKTLQDVAQVAELHANLLNPSGDWESTGVRHLMTDSKNDRQSREYDQAEAGGEDHVSPDYLIESGSQQSSWFGHRFQQGNCQEEHGCEFVTWIMPEQEAQTHQCSVFLALIRSPKTPYRILWHPIELKEIEGSIKQGDVVLERRFDILLPSVSHMGCTGSVCQGRTRTMRDHLFRAPVLQIFTTGRKLYAKFCPERANLDYTQCDASVKKGTSEYNDSPGIKWKKKLFCDLDAFG
ncbi:hypothetical protein Tco_1484341 [Tanacetum coccineum]